MIRLLQTKCLLSTLNSQNFFQLNPIYPNFKEKDFDIYNVKKNKSNAINIIAAKQKRKKQVSKQLINKFLRKKYIKQKKSDSQIVFDQETNLPLGLNTQYDNFIQQFKLKKNFGLNPQSKFNEILLELIKKFKVKSQFQLLKLFRISIANQRKGSYKDKIRQSLIQQAIIHTTTTSKQIQTKKYQQEQLEEEAFQKALKSLDEKIQLIQKQVKMNSISNLIEIIKHYPDYYRQQIYINPDNDITFQNNLQSSYIGQSKPINKSNQNWTIDQKIKKLFILRQIEMMVNPIRNISQNYELPIELKKKQNIMNQLAYKYKQYDLLQQPNLQEIYRDLDCSLKKINVKLSQDKSNSLKDKSQNKSYNKEELIWLNLNVQEIFSNIYYSQTNIKSQSISQTNIQRFSPNVNLEISLNRLPMNLYRHSQCQVFGIFTKYRNLVLKDVFQNKQLLPQTSFKYFSLQKSKKIHQKGQLRNNPQQSKYFGKARRKKCQAEVYLTEGNGKVTINGKDIADYYAQTYYRVQMLKPLVLSKTAGVYDLEFHVAGGGQHGQSQCMAFALTRALIKTDPSIRQMLYPFGLVGYDTRAKQAKKMNLYSARIHPPYVRR